MRVSGASFLDHRNQGGRRDRLNEAEARRENRKPRRKFHQERGCWTFISNEPFVEIRLFAT
jgi:hypothetical protein